MIENLEAWFRRGLFFRCLRHLKQWGGARQSEETIEELEATDQVFEILRRAQHDAGRSELIYLARELLETLDSIDKKIVEMSVEGFTSQEVATRLGFTAAQVRQRKARSLKRLRSILGEKP